MQPAFPEFRNSRKSRKPKGFPGAPETPWVFVEFHQSGIPRKPKPFPAPGSPLEFWAGPGSRPELQGGARGWKRLGFSRNSTLVEFHENPRGFGGARKPLGFSRFPGIPEFRKCGLHKILLLSETPIPLYYCHLRPHRGALPRAAGRL